MLHNKRTQAELSILFVSFIWGTTFVIVKNALVDIGPFLFLAMRFISAFLLLAVLSFHNIKQISWSTIRAGSLLGFFLFAGYVFQTVGLQYTTSSNAGFITGLNVVLVPVIYSFLSKTLPTRQIVATVILATTGLYLMSVPATSFHLAYGDLLVLCCSLAFAFHVVYVGQLSHKHNAVAITGIQILFVGLLCLVISLLMEPWPATITYNVWSALLITSVLATSLAFLLQNALQKYSTPTRFAIVLATEPVFAGLAGFLWGHEILSHRAMMGAALILAAMLLSILLKSDQGAKN